MVTNRQSGFGFRDTTFPPPMPTLASQQFLQRPLLELSEVESQVTAQFYF
jgi:hypothetical protein